MPTIHSETKVDVFVVPADEVVFADVRIGNAQPGGWAAFKGDKLLKKGGPEDRDQFRVGKGSALHGKQLLVNSFTTDIRDETDRVNVTVHVSTPSDDRTVRHAKKLDSGGMANFTTIIVFIAR